MNWVNRACLLFSPCCVAFICTRSRLGTAQQIHFPIAGHCSSVMDHEGVLQCFVKYRLFISPSQIRFRFKNQKIVCSISNVAERWINKKGNLTASKQFQRPRGPLEYACLWLELFSAVEMSRSYSFKSHWMHTWSSLSHWVFNAQQCLWQGSSTFTRFVFVLRVSLWEEMP